MIYFVLVLLRKFILLNVFLACMFCAPLMHASEYQQSSKEFEVILNEDSAPGGYLARIELNEPQEVKAALSRALDLYEEGELDEKVPPLAFVLHGPEVSIFLQENYTKHRDIVDLAERLTKLNIVNVRVCETRLNLLKQNRRSLVSFVETVPLGPREVRRLIDEEAYRYF